MQHAQDFAGDVLSVFGDVAERFIILINYSINRNLKSKRQTSSLIIFRYPMEIDKHYIEPLLEWNRLARENTENAMVSSMFEAAVKTSEPVDKFSTWLLVGAATVASFLIANSDKTLPLLGSRGFIICGAFLCLSCVCGLGSKMFGLFVTMNIETGAALSKTFVEHYMKYQEEELKIKEGAKFWGIDLQTGIRMERILTEFCKPYPKWITRFIMSQLKKNSNNPQVGHLLMINNVNIQGYFTTAQAVAFFAFMVSGFVNVVAK